MRLKYKKKRAAALMLSVIFAVSGLAPAAAVFAEAENDVFDVIANAESALLDGEGDDDGLFDTGESGAGLAAAQTPGNLAAPAPDFSDLSASYADLTLEEKAEILNRLGVLLGDPDRGLMLDIKVRRSDAAVFFTRLLGQEQHVKDNAQSEYATTRFPDAPEGKWYTPYIAFCASIGIVAGRTDGYYYPDENISEKEFANVLLKILGYEYQLDYTWDTVYEFAYDVGLFEDPSYAVRKEDNREYYRRDVCDQVFAVLSLEKKDSPLLLIEELVETGAISQKAALDLGFDLSGLGLYAAEPGEDDEYFGVDADIMDIYHLEKDLLWVIFTKPVMFNDDSIEICQTYDYSKTLSARVEEKTERDMLLRTGEQLPEMDYTIDIGNVREADGTNAGMLSFDFTGYSKSAARDTPAGLTTLKRGVDIVFGGGGGSGAGGAGGVGAASGSAGPSGSNGAGGPGTAAVMSAGSQADPSVEYFRVINAYTAASDELLLYFSQPVTETALNASFYNIVQDGAIMCSGTAGQIRTELVENTVNAIRLLISGFSFVKGGQYAVTVSGRLTSSYTARLNEGAEDSYAFTGEAVAVRSGGFALRSAETASQYVVELEFSQPVSAEAAKQLYNYALFDQNNRKMELSAASVVPDGGTGGAGAGAAPGAGNGKIVRLSLLQPLLTYQNCALTIIYLQNAQMTETIINQTYQFSYGGQGETLKKSALALTGAISNDPSTVELYFSQKLDPASAVVAANYSVNGVFDGKTYTVTPVKATYDPVLTPYMVRLYFQPDRRFVRDRMYSLRINNSIRDEKRLNPERTLEMQFFANDRDPANVTLKDAAYIGDGIVRLDFSKEIMFDPARIAESNFSLIEAVGAGSSASPAQWGDYISPILVKYINATTVILKFDAVDMSRKYRVCFNSLTDVSGQYTTRYPEQGSSLALREGKR